MRNTVDFPVRCKTPAKPFEIPRFRRDRRCGVGCGVDDKDHGRIMRNAVNLPVFREYAADPFITGIDRREADPRLFRRVRLPLVSRNGGAQPGEDGYGFFRENRNKQTVVSGQCHMKSFCSGRRRSVPFIQWKKQFPSAGFQTEPFLSRFRSRCREREKCIAEFDSFCVCNIVGQIQHG